MQGALPYPDRHTLAILATGRRTFIQRQVVADQCLALDRCGDLAVFDQIRLSRGKGEAPAGDVHLPPAEVCRVDTTLNRTNDLLRLVLAIDQVGIGYAR